MSFSCRCTSCATCSVFGNRLSILDTPRDFGIALAVGLQIGKVTIPDSHTVQSKPNGVQHMRIEVKSGETRERSGVAKATGKPYKFVEQSVYMDLGKPYPSEVRLTLQDGQRPFAPGAYQLTARCFYVDRFGGLNVDLSNMVPAAEAVRPVSAAR